MALKLCRGCVASLPLEAFDLVTKRGVRRPAPRCRLCTVEQRAEGYQRHREKRLAGNKRRYHADPEKRRAESRSYHATHKEEARARLQGKTAELTYRSWCRRLRLKGLEPVDYHRMLEAQGSRCAICRSDSPGRQKNSAWAVDHCHATGRVRGLLCHRCNMAIGLFQDDPETLQRAALYVTPPPGDGSGQHHHHPEAHQ